MVNIQFNSMFCRYLATFLFLLIITFTKGYSQVFQTDTLIINEKKLVIMHCELLEQYFKKSGIRPYSINEPYESCQTKEYAAYFNLTNKTLILIDIKVKRNLPDTSSISSINDWRWPEPHFEWVSGINQSEVGMKIEWVNGIVIFPFNQIEGLLKYKNYLLLEFDKGILIQSSSFNLNGFVEFCSKREKELINPFIYTLASTEN